MQNIFNLVPLWVWCLKYKSQFFLSIFHDLIPVRASLSDNATTQLSSRIDHAVNFNQWEQNKDGIWPITGLEIVESWFPSLILHSAIVPCQKNLTAQNDCIIEPKIFIVSQKLSLSFAKQKLIYFFTILFVCSVLDITSFNLQNASRVTSLKGT